MTTHGSVRAIAAGAAALALLDGIDAVLFAATRGVTGPRVFQSIAAGLLGRAAFQGGVVTTVAGAALHVLIASTVVLVFHAAATRWPALLRRLWLNGPVYGLLVYAVMNGVVIPLSAIGPRVPGPAALANGLLVHAVVVGPVAALAARAARRVEARAAE